MPHKLFMTGTLLSGFFLCALIVEAQGSGGTPGPAMAGGPPILQSDRSQDTPDTRPLAGAQNLSLGSTSHSFLLPSFSVITQGQTNPYNPSEANRPSLISATYLSGRLGVNKISGRSELLVDYLAGGEFSNNLNQRSALIQSMDFSETVRGGRWSQMFADQFTYLPESSFGFGGLSGLGNLGVSLGNGVGSAPGFRQDVLPDQSILTRSAPRIGNTVITQTTYALGYRSSLTFIGSYGILNFVDGGLLNSSNAVGRAGYNYLLSPLNSIAVSYGFNRLRFSNLPLAMDDHVVQVSFARRITGRLSFQVGAGPDLQTFKGRVAGPARVLSWVASSAINYQLRQMRAGISYNHSLGGGGGVLPGAETDVVSGELGRTFETWDAAVSFGYASDRALEQTILNAGAISPQRWFVTARVNRRLAGYGSLFVAYNASRQSSLAAVCSLPACRANGLMQIVSIGYNWGLRPIMLE